MIPTSFNKLGNSGNSVNELPYGYSTLTCITRTGVSYFDTGVIAHNNMRINAKMHVAGVGYAWGNIRTSGDIHYSCSGIGTSYQYYGLNGSGPQAVPDTSYYPAGDAIYEWDFDNYKQRYAINGVVMPSIPPLASTADNYSMLILMRGLQEGLADYQTTRTSIYHFKVWERAVMTHHMVPALDSTGVPCLYDLIARRSIYAQGDGALTYET